MCNIAKALEMFLLVVVEPDLFQVEVLMNFLFNIIAAVIGSGFGGFLVYLYVMRTENKRDVCSKNERCTNALLQTQLTMILQIDVLNGMKGEIGLILNTKLKKQSLESLTQDLFELPEIIKKLRQLGIQEEDINGMKLLLRHLLISPIADESIKIPYEILGSSGGLLSAKKMNNSDLATYLRCLANCNKQYAEIISRITQNNDVRGQMLQQMKSPQSQEMSPEDVEQYIAIISAKISLFNQLKSMIANYLEEAREVFAKTEDYINLLGVSEPIPVQKNEDGKIL